MTRKWFAPISESRQSIRTGTARPRRRSAGLSLESLEVRLALSSVPSGPVPLDLNPQPLPPGFMAKVASVTPDATGARGGTHGVTPSIIAII